MNSLFQQLNPTNQVNPQLQNNPIQQIIQMAKSGANPMSLLGNNPQLSQLLNFAKGQNISPKQLFFNMAQQQGINPQEIISMLK